jgi:prepilin-type processing-associated H-X9-DG protein
MKGAKESLGRANRRSTWTTTYQNIRSAELTAQDFEFKPPEGAVLKENLFDMKEAMATHAQTIALKCMISLGRIGTAMRQYAKDHDGRFPKSSKWCDELCGKYIGAWFVFLELPEFSAGDTDLKATDYGFNENLSGIKMTEVRDPARTVLAFEAERGQNVSGGSTRIISTPRHGEGFNIVFVDGHTETVPKGELGKLVWTVKER